MAEASSVLFFIDGKTPDKNDLRAGAERRHSRSFKTARLAWGGPARHGIVELGGRTM
jgi:hypothetical protein